MKSDTTSPPRKSLYITFQPGLRFSRSEQWPALSFLLADILRALMEMGFDIRLYVVAREMVLARLGV